MARPAARYAGPQGMNGPFGHTQIPHSQHHTNTHQQIHHNSQNHNGLPHTSLGGHPAFGPTNASSNIHSAFGFGNGAGLNNGTFEGSGISGHGAQLSSRNAQMQHFQNVRGSSAGQHAVNGKTDTSNTRIRNVWASNLHAELAVIRDLVDEYPYISMDTEFPGIIARPMGAFGNKAEYHYQTLRCNVDLLRMIQLGITLFSASGDLPPPSFRSASNAQTYLTPCPCTWQFNFKFSLDKDMYAADSTEMLTRAGINFAMHESDGIEPEKFGSIAMMSGLFFEKDVHWISFHSGYDFGYLMKTLNGNSAVPEDESKFHEQLEMYFPSLYDIKFLMKHASRYGATNDDQPLTGEAKQMLDALERKSGLQDIADALKIARVGTAHQAGSDSLITGQVFFAMRDRVFGGNIDEDKYLGQIWGLNGQINMGGVARNTDYANRHLETPNLNGAVIYSNGGTPHTPRDGNSVRNHDGTPGPQAGHGPGIGMGTPGGGTFGNFQYNARS